MGMAKAKHTMFDSGQTEKLPVLEPDKRVGGDEFVGPMPNNAELVEESGFWGNLWDKGLEAADIKPLAKEREEEEKRKAEKLTKENVPPVEPPPPTYAERFMSVEENPLLKNLTLDDVKGAAKQEDGSYGFNGVAALTSAASALGVTADFSNLSEMEVSDLAGIAESFASVAEYNDAATAFGVLGNIADGYETYTEAGNNATGIMGLMSAVSGESALFEYLDIGAEAAFVHALLEKAIDLGIPEMIDNLTGLVHNSELGQLSLDLNLSTCALQSKHNEFKKLYEFLWNSNKNKNRDKYLRELIGNYNTDKSNINKLIDVLDEVDSKWNVCPIQPSKPYLYYYSFASSDATKDFKSTAHWRNAMAGSMASAKTSDEILRFTMPSYGDY